MGNDGKTSPNVFYTDLDRYFSSKTTPRTGQTSKNPTKMWKNPTTCKKWKNKKMKIGIGSSQLSHTLNDPFTSEERKKFLECALEKRRISSKRYEIYDIPDIFNAKKWVDHVISIVGEINSVYSNSDWVRELFFNKRIKVAKKVTIFKKKFNANNIRNLIAKNDKKWKSLVPKEVVELIEEFNGIERIKSLYGKI